MFGDDSLVLGDFRVVIKKDNDDNNGDNSPVTSNPVSSSPQPITNSNEKSDNSVSPDNSPKPNPEKDSLSEEKNSKEDNAPKSTENSPVKTDNQTPISQYLRDIKQVTLTSDGNLIIEFNNSASNHSTGQVITTEQISTNQELQKIKNYCQQNGKNSLSQQELSNILGVNSASSTEKPPTTNNILLVGIIGGTLVIGIGIGLLSKRRKNKKKKS